MKWIITTAITISTNALRNTVILQGYTTFVQPPTYSYTDYVPYAYMNIAAGTDLSYYYNSKNDCNLQCSQTSNCIGFVTDNSNDCWLKPINSNIQNSSWTTSYYRVQPKRSYAISNMVEYQGTVIIYYQGPFITCQQACDALTGCVGYVRIFISGH